MTRRKAHHYPPVAHGTATSAVITTTRPRPTRAPWLACPRCGHVSKAAGYRHADGTCVSLNQCDWRLRQQHVMDRWTLLEPGSYRAGEEDSPVAFIWREGDPTHPTWYWDVTSPWLRFGGTAHGQAKTLNTAMVEAETNIDYERGATVTAQTMDNSTAGRPTQRGEGVSIKTALFDALLKHSGPDGRVYADVESLARELGQGPHTITHLLYSLQKRGLVSFTTHKGAKGADVIVGLRLQKRNVTNAVRAANKEVGERTDVDEAALIAADVALDMTKERIEDWMNEPMPTPEPDAAVAAQAITLIAERTATAETVGSGEPSSPRARRPRMLPLKEGALDGDPPVVAALAEIVRHAPTVPSDERIDAVVHGRKVLAEYRSAIRPKDGYMLDQPSPGTVVVTKKPSLTDYPALLALTERDAKRRHAVDAAVALEKAGLLDLGAQALTAIPDDNELEHEVLDLLAKMGVA